MGWLEHSLFGAKIGYLYLSDCNFWNDLVDFKKITFLWKLIKLHTFPISYFSKVQNRFFIKNHPECYIFSDSPCSCTIIVQLTSDGKDHRSKVKFSKCSDWAEIYIQWSFWHSKHLKKIFCNSFKVINTSVPKLLFTPICSQGGPLRLLHFFFCTFP